MLHLFRQPVQLRVDFGAFHFSCVNLLAKTIRSLRAFLPQLRITLCLGCLPFQGVHLARHFFENVVDAIQVELGIFQACFRQPLLGLEFGYARRLFDDRAAIRRPARQDLSDAPLLDQRVRFRTKSRPINSS